MGIQLLNSVHSQMVCLRCREPTGVKISAYAGTCQLKDRLKARVQGRDLKKDVVEAEVKRTFPAVRVNSCPEAPSVCEGFK